MPKSFSRLLLIVVIAAGSARCFSAAGVLRDHLDKASETRALIDHIRSGGSFSFVYAGKSSHQILARWKKTQSSKSFADGRTLLLTTYRDAATGLEVSSEITSFSEAPAVECLLRMRNIGTRDSPLIENILPLDLRFATAGEGKVVLHSVHGGLGRPDDYLPMDDEIEAGSDRTLTHYLLKGNEHVDGQLPFFNLQWQKGGLIGAVGWTGQWAIRVSGGTERQVSLKVGQRLTHLRLYPGESIRTPRILLLQWHGADRLVGHNQFRKLLLAHYVPRIDGKTVVPPIGNSNAFVYMYQAIEKKTGRNPLDVVAHTRPSDEQDLFKLANDALNHVNEKNQLDFIRGIPPFIELYWLDAGWFEGDWPFGVGTWNPDAGKFPHGLRPLADAAHEKGMKFLLWFEPGRVGKGSLIALRHPEWVLHRPGEGKLGGLFNFGDPTALQWMTQTLSERIDLWGVDIYRQDSNICPLLFWRNADSRDRQGIAEIRWVEGLYELWDGLLSRHPKLMIDNANWRITGPDLEVMRRSVGSLTRSETECGGIPHPGATQVQTAELSLWIPIDMGAANGFDPYVFRSAATSGVGTGLDLRAPFVPMNQVRQGIEELKSLRPYWLGDYYPLTHIGLDERAWIGWQFHRPDLKAGFAVFFRRSLSQQPILAAGLQGLDPNASYDVTFARTYDVAKKQRMTATQLRDMLVEVDTSPGSLLVRYVETDADQKSDRPSDRKMNLNPVSEVVSLAPGCRME